MLDFVPVVVAAGGTVGEAVDHILATKLLRKVRDRHDTQPDDVTALQTSLTGWRGKAARLEDACPTLGGRSSAANCDASERKQRHDTGDAIPTLPARLKELGMTPRS